MSFDRRMEEGGRREGEGLLVGSSIFLIVPATQAASRLTMNSKPSLEIRVTKGGGVSDMVGRGCGTCTKRDEYGEVVWCWVAEHAE